MSVKFELDQGKVNTLKINLRKRVLNKVQSEILDRDWEMERKLLLNDFRFMHVNDRIKEFDYIFAYFIKRLRETLTYELDDETVDFLRKSVLTNYRDFLGSEGYVVDYYQF
ncbi:MAG: hypothetical protein ACTSSG_14695 [Candidatus Heimdallarchaeaceae archaeon]